MHVFSFFCLQSSVFSVRVYSGERWGGGSVRLLNLERQIQPVRWSQISLLHSNCTSWVKLNPRVELFFFIN